jgi:ABC-2 type transport system permease protein
MTTAVTIELPTAAGQGGAAGHAGLRQAMRAEWRKLASLRSMKWSLFVTLAATLLVTYLSTNGAGHHNRQWYQGFDPTNTALSGLAVGSLVVGVIGVLAVTGEYSSGTIRSSLAATPRRDVFFLAKVIDMALLAVLIGMVLSLASFFVGQAILSGNGAPSATLSDPGVLRALLESGAFLALLALFGVGIGAIIRHSAGAIAAFVGCTLLSSILLQRVPGNPGRFTPDMIYANSVGAVVRVEGALNSTTGFAYMALYTVVALSVGALVLSRRDA